MRQDRWWRQESHTHNHSLAIGTTLRPQIVGILIKEQPLIKRVGPALEVPLSGLDRWTGPMDWTIGLDHGLALQPKNKFARCNSTSKSAGFLTLDQFTAVESVKTISHSVQLAEGKVPSLLKASLHGPQFYNIEARINNFKHTSTFQGIPRPLSTDVQKASSYNLN